MSERERFEDWWLGKAGYSISTKRVGDRYDNEITTLCWIAWQAALAE